MTRYLYRTLILLHPREFRDCFADEMLWIYDETNLLPFSGVSLVADAAASLARQWVIGQAAWKIPVSLLGGMLYFMLALSLLVPHVPQFDAPADFSLSSLAWPDQPGR
jgi:hypothetical protein